MCENFDIKIYIQSSLFHKFFDCKLPHAQPAVWKCGRPYDRLSMIKGGYYEGRKFL